MKKVVIIRGSNLNKYEMQTFEFLADRFDIQAIAAKKTIHSIQNINLPIHHLMCSQDLVNILPRCAKGFAGLTLNRLIGINQMLLGLGRQLQGIDIVHTADPAYYYSYQAARLKKELGFKLLVTQWENLPFVAEWNAIQRKVKYTVLKTADHFLAVSRRAKETLILEGVDSKRITISPPGIDIERFKPREKNATLLKELGLESNNLLISYVGKLNYSKGVEFLLYAFKKLKSDSLVANLNSRIKLVFFGTGRKEKRLKCLTKKLGLSDDVTFYGTYLYSKIEDVYNTTDIFVLPSVPFLWWQEQLGMVLLESMASRCAVIGSQTGAIPEVIGDAGFLCQPGDFIDLYDKLKVLCLKPKLREELGCKARERVLQYYNARKNAEAFGKIYETT